MNDDDLSASTTDASKKFVFEFLVEIETNLKSIDSRLARYIEHLRAKAAQEQNAAMKAHLSCVIYHVVVVRHRLFLTQKIIFVEQTIRFDC